MRLSSTTLLCFFFYNDPATTEIYTLSLHDALPILVLEIEDEKAKLAIAKVARAHWTDHALALQPTDFINNRNFQGRSEEHSLNSSHSQISYAVFCLKKKKKTKIESDI